MKRIAYRIGDRENFVWYWINGRYVGEGLRSHRIKVERMGYPTVTIDDGQPMPTGFDVDGWNDEIGKRTGEQL